MISKCINPSTEEDTRAFEMNPDFAKAYYNRGLARAQQGNFALAMEDFTRAIEINPHHAQAYHNRGFTRYQQGDLAGAMEDLQVAADLFKQEQMQNYQQVMNLIADIRSR
jgi:tetratricopeptide (TPR) repeat protein